MMMHSKKRALSTSSSKSQAVERCGNLLERTDFAKEAEMSASQKLLAVSGKFQGQNMCWNEKKDQIRRYGRILLPVNECTFLYSVADFRFHLCWNIVKLFRLS